MEFYSAVTMKKLEPHESTQMAFTSMTLGDKSMYESSHGNDRILPHSGEELTLQKKRGE